MQNGRAAACHSRAGDRFQRLYYLGTLEDHDGNHSRADLALCAMLVVWTGNDALRMVALSRQPALMRPKWDERHTADGAAYGALTIRKALGA